MPQTGRKLYLSMHKNLIKFAETVFNSPQMHAMRAANKGTGFDSARDLREKRLGSLLHKGRLPKIKTGIGPTSYDGIYERRKFLRGGK